MGPPLNPGGVSWPQERRDELRLRRPIAAARADIIAMRSIQISEADAAEFRVRGVAVCKGSADFIGKSLHLSVSFLDLQQIIFYS